MAALGFALFDTAVGRCGLAWSEAGVVAVQLPAQTVCGTRERMLRVAAGSVETDPSPEARRSIETIRSHLDGGARSQSSADLRLITLDMSDVAVGDRRLYGLLRETEAGSRVTYGHLARQLGDGTTPRAVGAALGRNPFAIVVPCHRVVAANGRLGGFSAAGGITTKLQLLALESKDGEQATTPPPFDLEEATRELGHRDPVMSRLIAEHGPCTLRVATSSSVFAALVRAVVFQQLNSRTAHAIHARVLALVDAGSGNPRPDSVLAATNRELRAAGLSQAKTASLRDLARLASNGTIPSRTEADAMADEDVIERVSRVQGVGRWSAQMLLIFMLGRPDILPSHDFGLRSGFRVAYGHPCLPTPAQVASVGRQWAPSRTIASWYLWRAAETAASVT